MPTQYKYQAINRDGQRSEGVMTSEDAQSVLEFLTEQQLTPISVKKARGKSAFSAFGFFKGRDYEDLITFTNNLSTLNKAGIPILKSLSLIKIGDKDSQFNQAIKQIRFQIQSGSSLSRAMAEFPELFTRAYVSSVAAGEESGKLDIILDKLSPMLEKELELSRQIKAAIRYPIMVIGAIAAAFIVLITFVVPRFISFYGAFDAELPLPTRILLGISSFCENYWAALLAGTIILILGGHKLLQIESVREKVDQALLSIPIFGNIIVKGNIARFTMMFSILFGAGVPIVQAIELLKDSVKNSSISKEIGKLGTLFRDGQEHRLTESEFKHFPPMSLQMMRIGLESGSLDRILGEIGDHYNKEVHYISRQLTAIIEPILTVVMGVFVLIMALAIFMPMWNLIQIFKQ